MEAADEQRRQVVRDLHDGAQQRLVEAIMTLQLAQARGEGTPIVAEGIKRVRAAITELRELARGIHPSILTHRGLEAAVRRSPTTCRCQSLSRSQMIAIRHRSSPRPTSSSPKR